MRVNRSSCPVTLINPPKQTVIRKVPIVTERDIVAFYPFAAADGTFGCYFKLDASGTNKLMQHTIEYRDTLVVAMVNGRVASAMTGGPEDYRRNHALSFWTPSTGNY